LFTFQNKGEKQPAKKNHENSTTNTLVPRNTNDLAGKRKRKGKKETPGGKKKTQNAHEAVAVVELHTVTAEHHMVVVAERHIVVVEHHTVVAAVAHIVVEGDSLVEEDIPVAEVDVAAA
jgi:hypothetical protein